MQDIKIAASILSADFSDLEKDIKGVENLVELLHIDIMDGHFVPNITIGPCVISSIRKKTNLVFDVHLMIKEPSKFIEPFAKAGADLISFHIETTDKPTDVIKKIKSLGKKAAIALNPDTPVSKVEPFLEELDMVLLMTVFPGFSGQEFMQDVLPKIKALRKIYNKDIQVDGGINDKTGPLVVEAGANVLAAGSYIFSATDKKEAIRRLRCKKK